MREEGLGRFRSAGDAEILKSVTVQALTDEVFLQPSAQRLTSQQTRKEFRNGPGFGPDDPNDVGPGPSIGPRRGERTDERAQHERERQLTEVERFPFWIRPRRRSECGSNNLAAPK